MPPTSPSAHPHGSGCHGDDVVTPWRRCPPRAAARTVAAADGVQAVGAPASRAISTAPRGLLTDVVAAGLLVVPSGPAPAAVLGGQHAEDDGVRRCRAGPAGSPRRPVPRRVVVRGLATDHAAEADDRVDAPGAARTFARHRQLEAAGHPGSSTSSSADPDARPAQRPTPSSRRRVITCVPPRTDDPDPQPAPSIGAVAVRWAEVRPQGRSLPAAIVPSQSLGPSSQLVPRPSTSATSSRPSRRWPMRSRLVRR